MSGTATVENKKKLFIENLSWNTKWWGLKDHMKQAGNVVHADVFRDEKGRSRGCGLVEYDTEEEATKAIEELNKSNLDGREIVVRYDRGSEKKKKPTESSVESDTILFVGNLPWTLTEDDVKKEFESAGTIVSVELPRDRLNRSKGFARVEFSTGAEAKNAVKLFNGKEMDGRSLLVRPYMV